MSKGKLIIFSGLPGSGKSTLSKELTKRLSAVYLRIDTVEQGLRDVCGINDIEGMGYRLTYRIAKENLRYGNIVIADSVNPIPLCRHEWNAVASDVGAQYVNVEIACSDKNEHRIRVENRGPSVPGIKPPTWQDVLDREYHEWDMERIYIDTAGREIEDCVNSLINELSKYNFLPQT